MIRIFIRRDIVSQYKQTVLGPLYFALTPIIGTLINMLIFGQIAKLSTDGIPQFLFYMSGNLFWGYFATCLNAGKFVFQSNVGLFSQVYFPRLTVPISQNISALFKLSIQFMIFFFFYIYFIARGSDMDTSWKIILIPLLLLQCSLLGLGTGILMSSFTTKYRDLNFIYSFISSFWMYASPVVYPLSVIPEKWRYAASFNPMVNIIETARQVIFGSSSLEPIYILNGLITTVIMLFFGLIIFNRVENTFLDTV
ncbi:MAG: ABC transporter permease [Candidatus Marinimicrobia bacterium]|nr:ABC transporter permease [Candidatus Neomarinimicrobiota bacterium]